MRHFNRANDMWNYAEESKRDDNLRRDICAELALAIDKAGAPFPRAHAWLANYFFELGDGKNAWEHANIALRQNPNEFRAQLARILVAWGNVKTVDKFSARDIVWGGGLTNMIAGTLGSFTGFLVVNANAEMTQMNFKNELLRLAQIFISVCQTNTDVDEFIMMANTLIAAGDLIKDIPMPGGRPNLYIEIVNAPLNHLDKKGREQEIADVRRKAEGRSLLFKA